MRGLSLLLSSCGVVAGLLGWRLLAAALPADPSGSSMAVRLGQAAAALLPAAAVLAAMITAQMIARFLAGAFDPAGPETRFLRTNQRCIANTTEQLAVFTPALLALAAGLHGGQMPDLVALAAVFAIARLVFWAGYLVAPIARAPGMAATFAANIAALAAAAWLWLA